MTTVRITIKGKSALTTQRAMERYRDACGINTVSSMRSIIHRAGLEPAGYADDRTPLYLVRDLDVLMEARQGNGKRDDG